MKRERLIIISICILLIGMCFFSIVPGLRHRSEWNRTVKTLRALSRERVQTAVQGFTRDQNASGKPIPAAVALQDFVAGGYLRADEVAALDGAQTTVALNFDEADTHAIWIRVQFPDGCSFAEFTGGIIIGLPR